MPARVASRDRSGADRRLDADAAALRGHHQIEAAEDHWQRQPLAHVEAGILEDGPPELRVRFADELHAETEQAIEEEESADELARFVPRLRLPEHPPQDAE